MMGDIVVICAAMRTDGRGLNHAMLTELRKRGVAAVQSGESPTQVAATLGVNLRTLFRWLALYPRGGWDQLDARKRGGRPPKLDDRALRWIYRTLSSKNPQQLNFPFALWTAAMVQTLIAERYNVKLSHSSVCRLLHQLGLSPAPALAGVSAKPRGGEHWLTTEYPTIERRARREGAKSSSPTRPASIGLPQRNNLGSERTDAGGLEYRRTVRRQSDLGGQRPGSVALHADERPGHRRSVHGFPQAAAGQCAGADLCGRRWAPDASGKVRCPVCGGTGGETGVVLSATLFA